MLNVRLALMAGTLALTLSACGSGGGDDTRPAGGSPTGATTSGTTASGDPTSGMTTSGGGVLGGSGSPTGATTSGSTTGTDPGTPTGHTYFIAPGSAATAKMVEAMRGGQSAVVKGVSSRGTQTVDTFSLRGLSQALDRVAQECK